MYHYSGEVEVESSQLFMTFCHVTRRLRSAQGNSGALLLLHLLHREFDTLPYILVFNVVDSTCVSRSLSCLFYFA